jgi:hypothetical protein
VPRAADVAHPRIDKLVGALREGAMRSSAGRRQDAGPRWLEGALHESRDAGLAVPVRAAGKRSSGGARRDRDRSRAARPAGGRRRSTAGAA